MITKEFVEQYKKISDRTLELASIYLQNKVFYQWYQYTTGIVNITETSVSVDFERNNDEGVTIHIPVEYFDMTDEQVTLRINAWIEQEY